MQDISVLSEQELELVRNYLIGLTRTIQSKKGIGSKGGMLSEEETVINAILHPQRGDLVIYLHRMGATIEVFIQNPREPDNPFSIMNFRDHGRNPGRRRLNTSDSELKEDEFGLFLGTAQDREVFRSSQDRIISAYTVAFGVAEVRPTGEDETAVELRNRPIESCSLEDKWNIYKNHWDFDDRYPIILQQLFRLPVMFARYKQAVKQESLNLEPEHFKSSLNQMVRDIFPSNLRSVLRKDFPKDYSEKIQEVHDCLKSVRNRLGEKIADAGTGDYSNYLKMCDGYVQSILEKDPQLTRLT